MAELAAQGGFKVQQGFAGNPDPHGILANVNGCPHYQDPGDEAEEAAGTSRALSEMVAHLGSEFPTVAPDLIARMLEVSLGRTSGARVQNYRLVLAEREVRERLQRGLLRPVEVADEAHDEAGPDGLASSEG